MTETDADSVAKTHDHDAVRAMFDDAAKGKLSAEQDEAMIQELVACSECEKAWEEHLRSDKTQSSLSGLDRKAAPRNFEHDVEETIRRRSAGRFFGRRAFGDRVPFELLAVIAIAIAVAIYFLILSP